MTFAGMLWSLQGACTFWAIYIVLADISLCIYAKLNAQLGTAA